MARVVAEIEYRIRGRRRKRRSTSVSLPAPDGPETTNNKPGPSTNKRLSKECRKTPAVLTDWMLMRRLAGELDVALRSGRVREAGLTGDGRLGLRVRARGAGGDTLLIDAFALTPLVTLKNAPALSAAIGWSRAIADALL